MVIDIRLIVVVYVFDLVLYMMSLRQIVSMNHSFVELVIVVESVVVVELVVVIELVIVMDNIIFFVY